MMQPFIIVMGVSGCGKSTLGAALAAQLGIPFVEGDKLHPSVNLAKMAAGIPLSDHDREPFLLGVAEALCQHAPAGVVVSCSALKRRYRDLIRERSGYDVCFVLPEMTRNELERRMQERSGHFMPISLLDTQLADLEPPGSDECAVRLPGTDPLEQQVASFLKCFRGIG